MESAEIVPLVPVERPFPSSVELVLGSHATLVDMERANPLALEAAVTAMAPATKAAITADLKCFLRWCQRQHPAISAIPATPETLVHYLRWLAKGAEKRPPAKHATLARRIASIARVHRVLGFGDAEPLPTQAGMVRDTLKGLRRARRQRQRQAAPLRLGDSMREGQAAPDGVTLRALLDSCGADLVGLRDAALLSLAYDGGLRVSELVVLAVGDLRMVGDGSGRGEIVRSKTDQDGEGAMVWLSPDTMVRVAAWRQASGIDFGPVLRRVSLLPAREDNEAPRVWIGDKALTRQGVVAILRRRVLAAVDAGLIKLEPGTEGETVRALSAHSFRVGLTQDLFAAGEDGAGIALALRWSSPTTALRYARELAVGNNATARVLGSRRGGG